MANYWWKILKRMPLLLWESVGQLDSLLSGLALLWAFIGQLSFDTSAWLSQNANWGWLALAYLFVKLLVKAIYEEHKSIEEQLLGIKCRLAKLEDRYPQMLIRLSEMDHGSRTRKILAIISSDSSGRTVDEARLYVSKIRSEPDKVDMLLPRPSGYPQLQSTTPLEGVSIHSGSCDDFQVASYDASRQEIMIGHHHDSDSFTLPKGRYYLELTCTGRDARPGAIQLMIDVDGGNQLIYDVVHAA